MVHADFYRLARRRGAGPDRLGRDDRRARWRWSNGRSAPPRRCRPIGWKSRCPSTPARARPPPRRIPAARAAWPRGSRRARAVEALLERAGWAEAKRAPLHGDASIRAYERLTDPHGAHGDPDDRAAAPAGADAAFRQVLRGDRAALRPTSAPSSRWRGACAALGYSTPRIYAHSVADGLALIEDFGAETIVDANGVNPSRYAEAAALLADLHMRAAAATDRCSTASRTCCRSTISTRC